MAQNHEKVNVSVAAQGVSHANVSVAAQEVTKEVATDVLPVRYVNVTNAKVAEKLETPRKITIAGEVVGDSYFDGSQDIVIGTAVDCLSTIEIDMLMDSAMNIGG